MQGGVLPQEALTLKSQDPLMKWAAWGCMVSLKNCISNFTRLLAVKFQGVGSEYKCLSHDQFLLAFNLVNFNYIVNLILAFSSGFSEISDWNSEASKLLKLFNKWLLRSFSFNISSFWNFCKKGVHVFPIKKEELIK